MLACGSEDPPSCRVRRTRRRIACGNGRTAGGWCVRGRWVIVSSRRENVHIRNPGSSKVPRSS